mgnify:CR=1 FL=1
MKLSDTLNILKFHGFYKGFRRIIDEIFEVIFFDYYFNIHTRKLKFEKDYTNKNFVYGENKWYQPTYYTPLKKISLYLNKILLSKKNLIIFDLGAGFGKPLFIISRFINKNNYLVGIELDESFEEKFLENLKKKNKNIKFINDKVEKVDFEKIIQSYELNDSSIVIHNKNSFSRNITEKNLNIWRDLKKKYNLDIYYIFSNPEFEDLFHEEVIFKTKGWHKNFKINLYKI